MDLSFTLEPSRRAPHWGVSLEDIKAAADQRRSGGECGDTGEEAPIRRETGDLVHILACRLVTGSAGFADTEILGGSFNPLIARQLMVGEKSEDGIYLRALADVQGWVA